MGNKILMPPWWVYQKEGAKRPASGRLFGFDFVGIVLELSNLTLPQLLP